MIGIAKLGRFPPSTPSRAISPSRPLRRFHIRGDSAENRPEAGAFLISSIRMARPHRPGRSPNRFAYLRNQFQMQIIAGGLLYTNLRFALQSRISRRLFGEWLRARGENISAGAALP